MAAGILTSLDAIAGKTLIVNTAALTQDNSAEVNIGYYGGATIVLFSDGEDTTQATRSRWRGWRRPQVSGSRPSASVP